MSKITLATGGILSFSAYYFGSFILSFISGSVSIISLAFLQFGEFGYKQSKKQTNDLNIFLNKLNLETVPVLEDNIDISNEEHNKIIEQKNDTSKQNININNNEIKSSNFDIPNNMNVLNNVNNNNKTILNHDLNSSFRKPKAKINNIIITSDTDNEKK
jgi:hypothetical protein